MRRSPARLTALLALLLLLSSASLIAADSASGGAAAVAAPQKFEFQAEVNRLMDIIIHSLYSNRDIFLRELVSNANDAIDKLRFLALTDPSLIAPGLSPDTLSIDVSADHAAKTVTIRDHGIGMTKEDLISHLGTIAKSGTASFLETATNNKDADSKNLIGQFGVGFYSAYLVADRVKVVTKTTKGQQYVWESDASQSFTIAEDSPDAEDLQHGTAVILYLKEDAEEYADTPRLKELLQKYSQFISFPIFLEELQNVDAKPDDDEYPPELDDKKDDDDDAVQVDENDDDSADDADEKKAKLTTEQVKTKTHINIERPLWLKDPSEVDEKSYNEFYSVISHSYDAPMAHSHFKAEGEIEFRSILYVPSELPANFMSKPGEDSADKSKPHNIRLFVRRVLVTDVFESTLLPGYLSFITGVVDSDDLPINISREMLQKSKLLDVIRRKLVRKALEMFKNIMTSGAEDENGEDAGEAEGEAAEKPAKKEGEVHPYVKFWHNFGRAIKAGVIDDSSNRQRLAKLLRFKSSHTDIKNPDDITSLDDYLDRMKEDQDYIYHLSGENLEKISTSPLIEKLIEKGYEVLYLDHPIDEHVITQLPEYEGSKFMAVGKDNMKLGDADQKIEKERNERAKKMYKPLIKYLKDKLGDKVSKVKLSTRLTSSPCVVSSDQYGYSAQMEIIMRSQAFTDPETYKHMIQKAKIMELNPRHALVKALYDRVVSNPDDPRTETLANLLYDSAIITSGYMIHDPSDFLLRMKTVLAASMDVDPDVPVEDFDFPEEEEEEEDADVPDLDGINLDGVINEQLDNMKAEAAAAADADAEKEEL